MPQGGTLTVRIYSRILDAGDVSFDAGDRSGTRFREGERAVIVEARDTGPGIAPENLTKVFEPFFSTKPTGKGMGLGLTVAKKIVDLHGGRITVRNADGGGVEVTMIFKAL
jgi:signal transduction histidine kinase